MQAAELLLGEACGTLRPEGGNAVRSRSDDTVRASARFAIWKERCMPTLGCAI
jgi:hypothetical protein